MIVTTKEKGASGMARKKAFVCMTVFMLVFASCAAFFTFAARTDVNAVSAYTIEATNDYETRDDFADALLRRLNERRQFLGSDAFEEDVNLMKTAMYEALYISQEIDPGEVFEGNPSLLSRKNVLYPFVSGRFFLIFDNNISSALSFADRAARYFEQSADGDNIFGGKEEKAGIGVVNSCGRTVVVIHLSSEETHDCLPEDIVTRKFAEETAEVYGENNRSDDTEDPYIYGDALALPVTGKEDFYVLADYVAAYDESGTISVKTSPAFVGPGYEGTVLITVKDGAGNSAQKSLPVSYVTASSAQIAQTNGLSCTRAYIDDEQASVSQSGSQGTVTGSHILFEYSGGNSGSGVYVFTFYKNMSVKYSVLKKEAKVVWNPEEAGSYVVKLERISADRRVRETISSVGFTVSEKVLKPFIPFELAISEDSSMVLTEEGYLIGLREGMTFAEIKSGIVPANGKTMPASGITIAGIDRNGEDFTPEDGDTVGTGMVLIFIVEDFECLRATTVLYGDVTGDGNIDISDFAKLRYALLGRVTLEDVWYEAANVAGRDAGSVDISDFAMLRYKLLGKTEIPQTQ